MIIAKEHKGNFYHYDTICRRYIRDEEGKMISTKQCLCYAKEPSECCCACDWSDYVYDNDYYDDYGTE